MVASLPGQPSGVALILFDAAGENQIVVIPGANGAIEAGYARECLGRLGGLTGDVVLVCNEVPLLVVRETLACAHAAGATTILNPAPATGIGRSVFALADIITPNRSELSMLLQTEARQTGHRTDAGGEIPVRARQLIEPGPDGPGVRKAVIVTLGASGVLVLERIGSGLEGTAASKGKTSAEAETAGPEAKTIATGKAISASGPDAHGVRIWEVPAERVATIDSTGAGDAFNGALAAAIAEGRSLAEAVQRAVAAGALATTHVGAREGMPTALELEEFLAAR